MEELELTGAEYAAVLDAATTEELEVAGAEYAL